MPLPAYSVLADSRYGKRQVVKFGGLPIPVVGTTQAYIDLMDGVSWFLDSKKYGIEIKVDHRLTSLPNIWRYKSQLLTEDLWPTQVQLDLLYDETSGTSLQNALAAIYGAGSQYLTFDNNTGLVARLNNVTNRYMRVTSAPYLWELQLQFMGYGVWWQDIAATVGSAQAIGGSVSPGTTTNYNITYPGNAYFSEPVWVLNIPNTNAAPISQFELLNLTPTPTDEDLIIQFSPALAAGQQWIITIDSSQFTITDQNGKQYSIATGSTAFPMLYGPANQVNSMRAILTTASGASSGVTLQPTWTNRWWP